MLTHTSMNKKSCTSIIPTGVVVGVVVGIVVGIVVHVIVGAVMVAEEGPEFADSGTTIPS